MDSLVGRGGGEPTAPAASVDAPIEVGNGADGGREEVVVGRAAVRVGPAQEPERLFIWAPISAPVPFAFNIHRVPHFRLSLGLGTTVH